MSNNRKSKYHDRHLNHLQLKKNAVSTLLNDVRCVKMNVGRRAGATARFDVGSVSLDFQQQRQRRSQSNFNREPLSRRHQRPHFYFSCFSFHSPQFPPPPISFSVHSNSIDLFHPAALDCCTQSTASESDLSRLDFDWLISKLSLNDSSIRLNQLVVLLNYPTVFIDEIKSFGNRQDNNRHEEFGSFS